MLSATGGTLASLQPRLNAVSTASLHLAPRGTANMGFLHAPPLRGRRLRNHALLPTISVRGRTHNAHSRAMPVAMNRNAGVLVGLEGHPCLVPMRVFAHRSGRLRDTPGLHGNSVARNSFLLCHRGRILRRA